MALKKDIKLLQDAWEDVSGEVEALRVLGYDEGVVDGEVIIGNGPLTFTIALTEAVVGQDGNLKDSSESDYQRYYLVSNKESLKMVGYITEDFVDTFRTRDEIIGKIIDSPQPWSDEFRTKFDGEIIKYNDR